MFKEYYNKEIEQIPVNRHLQSQLRDSLFSPAPPQTRWQKLSSVFKTRVMYSSVVAAAVVIAVLSVIAPTQTADATEAPHTPIYLIFTRVFRVDSGIVKQQQIVQVDQATIDQFVGETCVADIEDEMIVCTVTPQTVLISTQR